MGAGLERQLGVRDLHRALTAGIHRTYTARWPDRDRHVGRVAIVDRARIAAVPLFAGLSDGDVDRLSEVATEVELHPGAPLTAEGEFGHALYVVESGTADVHQDGGVVGSVGPGDVVGEIAVLSSGRRTATVVATSPMRLIALFKRDVWVLERNAPAVAERLRDLQTHRLGSRL
jgi:CRP/FNR family transcriptional regulator, cyclic AMP receptor protein